MSFASSLELAREVADGASRLGSITTSRFFGGAALKLDGIQFAFVMKTSLYLRVDDDGRAAMEALGAQPFVYAGASGPVTVGGYYEAPAEIMDDADSLSEWVIRSYETASALQRPKPSQARRPR
ncbi:MAG: Regulator of competence-specific s [Rhizobium sp.]|nr:Regulator of competence-specific s [Rhizobium sp.]